jgi:addiction module HigA family antidote
MVRTPIHPGEHLADELRALGMSGRELARSLDVPATRVADIIRGRRGISGDTALRLGRYFGTTPEFWMNLQSLYELDLARQTIGDSLATVARRSVPDEPSGYRQA